jgi:hypothetical protein
VATEEVRCTLGKKLEHLLEIMGAFFPFEIPLNF